MQNLIDEELQDLIPPLSQDEYATLERSILAEGCREPLILWRGKIVDGHHRFKICTAHSLPYKTVDKDFLDRAAAKVWMIDNQNGRRNLSDGWKYELRQAKKALLAEKGKANISSNRGGTTTLSTIDKEAGHDTRAELAADLGWSTGKVAMADKVWKHADKNTIEKIKADEISINQAYKDIKKTENKQQRLEREKQTVQTSANIQPIIKKLDAIESIKQIDDVDLLITDPPYFTDGDFTLHIRAALLKVKTTGQAYVFAGAYPDELAAYLNLETGHMRLEQILIWNYNNTGQRQPNTCYTGNYQVCLYYRGADAPQINKPADGTHQYACQTVNAPDARIGDRFHKWQKPLELLNRLIKNSSNENDLVFDPFAGSGSVLISAAALGRRAIGSEIDEDAVRVCIMRGCICEN